MKKIYKNLLLCTTTLINIAIPLSAIACIPQNEKLGTGTTPDENVIQINDNNIKELKIKTISIPYGDKKIQRNVIDLDNNKINLIQESIKNWLINKYWTNNELSDQVEDFLITDKRKLKNEIPNETKVKVLDKELTIKFKNLDKNLPQIIKGGKYGNRSDDREEQKSALKLESLNLEYKASFEVYYNDKILYLPKAKKFTIDTKKKQATVAIKPTFAEFNKILLPKQSEMKPIKNIDWTKVDYIEARITNVSDGDTFSFVPIETKEVNGRVFSPTDPVNKIRLSGIDTPEKAVSNNLANPFEYSFAIMSTHFAERLFKIKDLFKWVKSSENENSQPIVRVAYITGNDTYGRVTADVFFGPNFEYSYNTEIVRAGYTLPMQGSSWEGLQNIPDTYENKIYPEIKQALAEAIEKKVGFFHYFDDPRYISTYVYNAKPNNSYNAFWLPKDK